MSNDSELPGVTRIPFGACPHCGHIITAAGTDDGSAVAPVEGDATVCIACAEVTFFRADMTLRKPKDGELMTMLFRDPEWARDIAQMQRRIRETSRP